MQIQRVGRGSAYDNVNWGKGIDTHANELAKDYTDRVSENLKAKKEADESLLKEASEVPFRDQAESNKFLLEDRDKLAKVAGKWGATSSAFQEELTRIHAKQMEFKQKSEGFTELIKRREELKSNPYVKQDKADLIVKGELSKGLGRDNSILDEALSDPSLINIEAFAKDSLNEISKPIKTQSVKSDGNFSWIEETEHNPAFGSLDENGVWLRHMISDDVINSVVDKSPVLWDNLWAATQPEVYQEMKKKGVGKDMDDLRRIFVGNYLEHVQSTAPSAPEIKDRKQLYATPKATASETKKADAVTSVRTIATLMRQGNQNELSALFGKTTDGSTSKIEFTPDGNMMFYKKGAKRMDKWIGQPYTIAGASDEELMITASAIWDQVGKPQILGSVDNKPTKKEGSKAGRDGFKMNPK